MHAHHHDFAGRSSRVLVAAMALNLVIFLAELVGGLVAGSLALIADSFHNLTDLMSLVLVMVARRLQKIPASDRHTFGFRRADVMAGFINAAILLVAMGGVLSESVGHLLRPHPVDGRLMVVIGGIGLLANTLGVWLLHRDPTQDMGLASAALHLATDAASSAAVVLGGVLLMTVGWVRVDPILGILIALLAMAGAVRLLLDGVHILMEGTPRSLDAAEVRRAIEAIDGVERVEHFHLWSLASTEPSLTATILVEDRPVSEAQALLRRIEGRIAEEFGIGHTVLQVEAVGADDAGACRPPGPSRT
jgi:cation diffusion facilitator family transporter